MNILYLSSMFDNETYAKIFTKGKKPMHAANKYHQLLCKGLVANGVDLKALSVLPICRANYDKKYVKVKSSNINGFDQKYISMFNLPILRYVSQFFGAFFPVLFAKRKSALIYDVLVISASAGALLAAKLTGKKCYGIVTDLPQFMPAGNSRFMLKVNNFLVNQADGYIFLTEQMNDVANPKNKPYAVLEGHVDINMAAVDHADFDTPIRKVLYAGTLAKIYGIKNLCEGFAACDFKDVELHIYGDGNYAPELNELTKKHSNIIYHGNCPNDQVVEDELHSHLLVNPRPTSGEFTKYSFPSKTLEYMVSGTPVLTAHLAGIPAEYDDYLYYFDDTDPEGLTKALKEIMTMSAKELEERGRAAKEFALSKKSNVSQAKKILEFIKENQ